MHSGGEGTDSSMRRSIRAQLTSAPIHQKTQLESERGTSGRVPRPAPSMCTGMSSGAESGSIVARVLFTNSSKERGTKTGRARSRWRKAAMSPVVLQVRRSVRREK